LVGAITVEDDWTTFLILTHQARVLKVGNQGILSLDSGKGNGTYLLAIELFPFFVMKFSMKARNVIRGDEVDECVSNVAFVFEIDGKIEEVIVALVTLVNCCEEHLLTVFIGNVLDHQSGTEVPSREDLLYVEEKLRFVFV